MDYFFLQFEHFPATKQQLENIYDKVLNNHMFFFDLSQISIYPSLYNMTVTWFSWHSFAFQQGNLPVFLKC